MTTVYSAGIQTNNKTTGRLASPTESPTVACYNFRTGASLGAHDAYKIGDRVRFNGKVYESRINANVWSPSGYPAGGLEIVA
jgi:hypothetical protein